jgi:sulfur carrier protein ThiS
MAVKLVLRDKEYQVKPGMALRGSLLKIGLLPEATLAIRQGEMITEEEILVDGDVIKLVAVISGGGR